MMNSSIVAMSKGHDHEHRRSEREDDPQNT